MAIHEATPFFKSTLPLRRLHRHGRVRNRRSPWKPSCYIRRCSFIAVTQTRLIAMGADPRAHPLSMSVLHTWGDRNFGRGTSMGMQVIQTKEDDSGARDTPLTRAQISLTPPRPTVPSRQSSSRFCLPSLPSRSQAGLPRDARCQTRLGCYPHNRHNPCSLASLFSANQLIGTHKNHL